MCKLTKYFCIFYLFQREQEVTDRMTYRLLQLQLHLKIRNGRPAKIRKKTFGEGEVLSWDVALSHCI